MDISCRTVKGRTRCKRLGGEYYETIMNLLLLVIILFLLFGGAGFALSGTLGTVLIVLAVLWLVGGIGYHGSRSGWYGRGPGR